MTLSDEQCAVIKGRIAAAILYQESTWQNAETSTADVFEYTPARWLAVLRGQYWRNRRGADVPRRCSNQVLPKLRSKHDAMTQGETTFFAEPLLEQMQGREDDVAALMTSTWEAERFDIPIHRAAWDADIY